MKRHVFYAIALLIVSGCDSGNDGPLQICMPEEKKCDGKDVVKCNSSGTEWVFYKSCNSYCVNADCPGYSGCTPMCGGKQCGSDGCGGICGTCRGGTSCSANGLCVGGNPVSYYQGCLDEHVFLDLCQDDPPGYSCAAVCLYQEETCNDPICDYDTSMYIACLNVYADHTVYECEKTTCGFSEHIYYNDTSLCIP